MLPIGLVAAAMVPVAAAQSPAAPGPASEVSGRRVVVTTASASAYSCAAVTCRVVTELEKGATVAVLKSDGEWHQVMVRVGDRSMTTGWLKANQVAASAPAARTVGPAANAATLPGNGSPQLSEADPRGCLTCLATREPTPEEWNAVLAETATKKARPEADRPVTPGLADGRTTDERMRDRFAERYGAEVNRLAGVAASVDGDLNSYLSACFERFGSIKVEGAAPRRTAVDDILNAARATRGAARFALWTGSPGFAWNPEWAPQTTDTSARPSCERLWTDAVTRSDRLKVDLELLERDAADHDIYPGVIRDALAAHNLAEGGRQPQTPPVVDVR